MTQVPKIATTLLALLIASPALGQGPPAPSPSTSTACVVGAHTAELKDSARAATTLVCDALRARGVAIGPMVDDATGASAAYVVKLEPLGSAFSLTVTYQELGTVRQMRATSVKDLSELGPAAPALAAALTSDREVEPAPPPPTLGVPAPATTGAASPPPVAANPIELTPALPPPPDDRTPPPQDWRAVGHLGGFGDRKNDGGGVIGVGFQYRAGPLVGGLLLESGGKLFSDSYWGAAALGGFGMRPTRHIRVQLLGELGGHYYTGVGRDWVLGNDPGASGGTGYAGARFTLSYLFGHKLKHLEVGAYADFQDDFSRTRVRYGYPSSGSGWFDGGGTGDHVIGTSRLGFGIEIGEARDIF